MVLALALGSQHQQGDRRIHTDKQADNSAPPRIIKPDRNPSDPLANVVT